MQPRDLFWIGLTSLAFGIGVICLVVFRESPPLDLDIDAPDVRSDQSHQTTDRLVNSQPGQTGSTDSDDHRSGVAIRSNKTRDPWKGVDVNGQLHRIGESVRLGVVFVFLNTDCPIANASIPRLNRLAEEFKTSCEFYGVASSSTARIAAQKHAKEFSIAFPVLLDTAQELQERLSATHSPHAFLLDENYQTIYQGAIDDSFPSLGKRRPATRHYLRDALTAISNGHDLRTSKTNLVGCRLAPIERRTVIQRRPTTDQPDATAKPKPVDSLTSSRITFTRHIAPLIFSNCSSCHQPQAVAPFSLLTFEDVVQHAPQIRVVVEHRFMPPWKPVSAYGEFRDEQKLTQAEIDTLLTWIDSGMPYGDESELPQAPVNEHGWQLGTPDLVLDVQQPFEIPADGPDIYQYFVIPTGLTDDRLVAAIEYRSGNPRVVHHASFRYDDAGNAKRLDVAFPGPGYQRFGGWGFLSGGTLGGWAMGVRPQRTPTGFGRPLKANSQFIIQTHYHPSGKPEQDQAKVGIFFAPQTTRRRVAEIFVADMNLHIPPNYRRHLHRASYQVPCDITIHSVLPHAHLLAREVRAWVTGPDHSASDSNLNAGSKDRSTAAQTQDAEHASVTPLIAIDDWNFNWQGSYVYRKPLRVLRGSTIHFEVVFDNSALNPLNPHTIPEWVHWGEASTQEMAVCFFDVTTDQAEQLDALVQHNRSYIMNQEGNGPFNNGR